MPATDLADLVAPQPQWFKEAFAIPRRQGQVMVDGVAINYLQWGDPENPGVVMAHGMMAHARCWAFIAPLLASRYCLTAFDLSGMGDSGWRQTYNFEARAAECIGVAEGVGFTHPEPPALVCHSYGGSVGLMAAERSPDAWSKLIVCDMTMLAPGEASRFEEFRKRREARKIGPHRPSADLATVRERFKLAPPQPCDNEFLMEYMARHSVKPDEQGFIWKFDPKILVPDQERHDEWWQSIATRFSNLELPRAIVYGERSEMMSDAARTYVSEQTGGTVPMVQIDRAYHHIMLDQPLAVVDALANLLEDL
ncbi:MAG: alpha/beta hydrolase [Pseudomonadota bacterium]